MDFITQFPLTFGLIAANVVASMIAFQSPQFRDQNLFVVGPILKGGEVYRVVTSGFLHGGSLHLLANMVTLYYFGPPLERWLGGPGYLAVYFGALIGGGAWLLLEKRRILNYAALGASGAVSGVLIAFCLFEPFAMLGIFFIIPMPAFLFAALFIGLSAYLSSNRPGGAGGIAHEAHLGGAVVGGFITVLLEPGVWGSFLKELTSVFG
ncbi:MAG: rhomboid family intramembrane serine protease [Pseudomonadota bacterium]